MDRKLGEGTVVVAAMIAALLVGGAVAIAGSDDVYHRASVQDQIKKLSKKVKKASKTADEALKLAKQSSTTPGPQGPAGAPGLVPIVRASNAGTVSTTVSGPPASADLGGPSVTLTVGPSGGFVQVLASAEVSTENGATACNGLVTSPGFTDPVFAFNAFNTGPGFVQANVNAESRFLPPGTHTLRLDYFRNVGSGTCSYKNRRLTVALFE